MNYITFLQRTSSILWYKCFDDIELGHEEWASEARSIVLCGGMSDGSSKGCDCSFWATGRREVGSVQKNTCPCQSIEARSVDITRLQVPPRAPKNTDTQLGIRYFLLRGVCASPAMISGSPTKPSEADSFGERSCSKMSKFSRWRGNEGYGACSDAVPPRAPKRQSKGCLFFCQSILGKTRFMPLAENEKSRLGHFCVFASILPCL